MTFRKIKWPKSQGKPKLGVGGVLDDAVPRSFRTRGAAPEHIVSSWHVNNYFFDTKSRKKTT